MQHREAGQPPGQPGTEHRAEQFEVLVVDPHHAVLPLEHPGRRGQPPAGGVHRQPQLVDAAAGPQQHPAEHLGTLLVGAAHGLVALPVEAAVEQQIGVPQGQPVLPGPHQPGQEVADQLLPLIGQQLRLQRRVDQVALAGGRLGRVEAVQQTELGEVLRVEHPRPDGVEPPPGVGEQLGGLGQVPLVVRGVRQLPGAGLLEVRRAGEHPDHEGLAGTLGPLPLAALGPLGGGARTDPGAVAGGGAVGGAAGAAVAAHRGSSGGAGGAAAGAPPTLSSPAPRGAHVRRVTGL